MSQVEQVIIVKTNANGSNGANGAPRKLNKFEVIKQQKDGYDVLPDIYRYAESGDWKEIPEDDRQRMKWHGVFFRNPTPGNFMMRVRITSGQTNSKQFRVLADLSDEFGKGFADITTRQQIQLRWMTIDQVPEIWRRLEEVGLHTKQTGMDNVRGVCGCPVAGLTPKELLDASFVAREFTDMFVGNKEFTNLPRKFNVTVTGCLENCCHAETQDLALVPAIKEIDGEQVKGLNVLVGGKKGSGGYRIATNINVFVTPDEAAAMCREITLLFRDHGPREARNKARLAFLIEERGALWFRHELERRWGKPLMSAGIDQRESKHNDHIGVFRQKQSGLNYVGLLVPVGRITTAQMRQVADLADRYGSGDIRLTVGQNIVIPNVPDNKVGDLTAEPLLKEFPYNPSPILRGLVACVGSDYCSLALIDSKGWAIRIARELEKRLGEDAHKLPPLTIHWSGCPAGCGNHHVASIGLEGTKIRVNGKVVEAAQVFVKGRAGVTARLPEEILTDVPCEQLAAALEPLVRHLPRK